MKVKKGDLINTIIYRLPKIGSEKEPSIIIRRNREVIKAGDKSFTISTNEYRNNRYSQDAINKTVEGLFKNSYVFILPSDADLDKELDKIKILIKEHYKKLSVNALKLSEVYSEFSSGEVAISES